MKKMIVALIGIFLVGVLVIFAQSSKHDAGTLEENVQVDTFKVLVEKAVADTGMILIDVRTPAEFNSGHISGAVNIDYKSADFEKKIEQLDKSKTYLLYCRSGNRSGRALQVMKSAGFKKVVHLAGGIKAWNAKNLSLVSD